MHTVFALPCFVVVIHWLIFPYPSGLLHWHCGNLTIAPVPAKQPWWIWINTSCEFIMNDCTTTTKQSTTKPCAYFLGYTVSHGYVLFTQVLIFDMLCLFRIQTMFVKHGTGQRHQDDIWLQSSKSVLLDAKESSKNWSKLPLTLCGDLVRHMCWSL